MKIEKWVMVMGLMLAVRQSAAAKDEIMIYDEQKGIIFADKNQVKEKKPAKPSPSSKPRIIPQQRRKIRAKTDLHIDRKKDPPELYFSSGLEFFKSGDYQTALKNFLYADSVQPEPRYKLWAGKTYRKLSDSEKMLDIMNGVLEKTPESDVADDALFEIAFYHHTSGDYEKAINAYTQLAEQYPFGKSFSNDMEFMSVAKEQKGRIRAEVINLLSILGYTEEDLVGNVRRFQRQNNLKPTGRLDKKTVQTLKKRSKMVFEQAQGKAQKTAEARKHTWWMVSAGIAASSLCVLAFSLSSAARSRVEHLNVIEDSISDMGR
ncbi:MAG: peptidoglycan-binding protein [Chitinispirillaceae bacterium]